MPAEIITTADCASLWGVYDVPSDSSPDVAYRCTLHGEGPAFCPCTADQKNCKHLERLWKGICKWNIQWSEGNPDPEFRPIGYTTGTIVPGKACPACGGPMVAVRRAV